MSERRPILISPFLRWGLLALIAGGSVLLSLSLYYQYRQRILSFDAIPVELETVTERFPEPRKLIIPNQNLELKVDQSQIKNGVWEISDSAANHLDLSARPGEGGNVVMYGHNKTDILGKLHQVQVGDVIKVINQDGQEFVYRMEGKKVVNPDKIDAVLSTNYEKLTIYTCTGFLDSKRLILEGRLQAEQD